MIAAKYDNFVLVNVYRYAKNRLHQDFTDQLLRNIEHYKDQSIVICGDFNLDLISDCNNVFTKKLTSLGFNHLETVPTHILRGTIDQMYFKHRNEIITVDSLI